jgi:hypothetical protein
MRRVLGLLVSLSATGAVALSTAVSTGAGEGEKKAGRPGAPARKVRVVLVASPQEGTLAVIGTVVKKG